MIDADLLPEGPEADAGERTVGVAIRSIPIEMSAEALLGGLVGAPLPALSIARSLLPVSGSPILTFKDDGEKLKEKKITNPSRNDEEVEALIDCCMDLVEPKTYA